MQQIDISHKPSPHSIWNKIGRVLWFWVYWLLFRPSPRFLFVWRIFLLRCFGARVSFKARVHPTAKIWAPWNLVMGDYATLAPGVDCYCVATVSIGAHATVSQYSYLCSATHDFEHPNMPLVSSPIVIHDQAWICADVFIGPGVTIGEGCVIGARSSVFSDMPAWHVCCGTPAAPVRKRVIKEK